MKKAFLKLIILTIFLFLIIVVIFGVYKKFTKPQLESKGVFLNPSSLTQLVSGFPEFPVYPGVLLKNSDKENLGDRVKYEGSWETENSVSEAMIWYTNHLEGSDWKIDVYPADPNASEVQFLVAKKQDLTLNLSVIRENETTTTSIVAEFLPSVKEDEE